LALEDGTELCVVKNSHTKMLNDLYKEGDTNAFTVLKLQKGEYVIVHPCTVHFGAPYNRVNTRLHWYMDSMLFSRPKNSTNLLDNINFVSNVELAFMRRIEEDERKKLKRKNSALQLIKNNK
jgi:hypothetical protein